MNRTSHTLLAGLWLACSLALTAAEPTPPAPAPAPAPTAEALAAARELLGLMHMADRLHDQVRLGFDQYYGKYEKRLGELPEEVRTAYQAGYTDARGLLNTGVDYAALLEDHARIYAEVYTSEELAALRTFIATPAGQAIALKNTALSERMAAGQAKVWEKLHPQIRAVLQRHAEAVEVLRHKRGGDGEEIAVGKPFPAFTGEVMPLNSGDPATPITSTSYRGKVLLLSCWATWNRTSRTQVATLADLYTRHHPAGLEILSLSVDEEPTALRAFLAKNPLPWTHLCDGKGWEGELARKFNLESIPMWYVIGRDGVLVAKQGADLELEPAITQALGAAPAAPAAAADVP